MSARLAAPTWWLAVSAAVALPVRAQAPDTVLTLDQAIQRALASHPSMAAARAGEAEAAGRVSEAVAARWPQLTTQGALSRFELPMIVAPLHGFDPNRPPTFDRTLVQGSGQLSWVVFDGGARGARIRGLRADQGAAQAWSGTAAMRLTAEVTRAYLEVVSARGRLEANRQSLTALAAERQRVTQALEVGRAAQVDLLRVEAALAQAETERVSTAADLEVARGELARHLGMGREQVRPMDLLDVVLTGRVAPPGRDALRQRALASNPDLAAARHRREAAGQARRAAQAAWFPRLELGGGYLLFGRGGGDFTSEWQSGVRLAYPVFQGGARRASVAAAAARADAAAAQYRLAELDLESALDRALARLDEAHARVQAISRAVAHLAEVQRIEQLALDAGAGTQSDFLRADADLRASRAGLIQARHAEILASVELLRLSGDLTPERLTQLLESRP